MTTAVSPITRQFSRPYLTLQEFKNAPTALDYGNLVVGGTQVAQDAELSNAITRASSFIDNYCNQVIGATLDTEQQRGRVGTDGSVIFHPKFFPIVALQSLAIGSNPQALIPVPDPSIAWLEEQQVVYPYNNANLTMSSQGPISYGYGGGPRARIYLKYTYINGYANTVSTANYSAGATSIVVAEGLGVIAGEMLNIYDGASTERIIVDTSYVFGSNTILLASPLQFDHNAGVSVSNLPASIKEAAILMTTAYLKIRGDASMTMAVTNIATDQTGGQGMGRIGTEITHVQELLKPFRRVR